MDGRAALSWLRKQEDAHAVEVVAALLRVCHAGIEELRQRFRRRPYESARMVLRKDAIAVLGRDASVRLDQPMLSQLADALERGFVTAGVPYACHTVATEIDIARGARFGEYFDGDGDTPRDRRLKVGDPFPIHPPPTLKLLERADSPGNPDNLTAPLVRTPRLGIVTDDHGVAVHLTCLRSRLAHVNKTTSIATIATNRSNDEFTATFYDSDGTPFPHDAWSGEKGYFYGVRPGTFGSDEAGLRAAAEEQRRRIETGVELVAASGAQIALLPELATTDELHAWLVAHPAVAGVPLFVAGSRHVAREGGRGPGVNEAQVLVRGATVARITKFADYNLKLPPPFPPVYFYEDLDLDAHPPSVHVLVGSNTSVIALICKDAMDSNVIAVVRMLAPTLFLVPTMSPEVDRLEAAARDLAHYPQTITAVANIGPVAALLARPSKKSPTIKSGCVPGRVVLMRPAGGDPEML